MSSVNIILSAGKFQFSFQIFNAARQLSHIEIVPLLVRVLDWIIKYVLL